MSPQQAMALRELALSHVMAAEILARAAFYSYAILGQRMKLPRSWAHETLASVLDEVELDVMQCQGRA